MELRINPWRWRSISRRAHMPCMPASGRLRLLPAEVNAHDPFAMALRRVEFESGRLLQAQIILLKGPNLVPFRDAVSSALERRHAEVRKLWSEALEGVGIATPRSE